MSLLLSMNKDKKVIWKDQVDSSQAQRIQLIDKTIQYFEEYELQLKIDRYEFFLVLDEAISNAMEHGNQWNRSKKVLLEVHTPENNSVCIAITDAGSGFDPMQYVSPTSYSPNMALRGRGIIIMKTFCTVTWNDKGNTIYLCIKLK